MKRTEFIDFLISTGLEKSASSTRASWCNTVEQMFNVNLDLIVHDKEQTLDLIEEIMVREELTPKKRNNYPNGVRKYYKFINGRNLGSLKDNNRR